MEAYMYRAALYCGDCGKLIKNRIAASPTGVGGGDINDSEYWPQGPYADGGGEADTPQHCDSCHVFLANPLTDDGDSYVREACDEYMVLDDDGASWATIADRAEDDGATTVAEWVRFYLAPGL